MKFKTIVVVNDFSFVNGGAGQVAISSAIGLLAKGYRVILFTAVGPVDENLAKQGIEVVCLNQYDILHDPNRMRAIIQGVWNVKAKVVFEKLLRTLNRTETIIHFHAWSKGLSSSLFSVTKKQGFKTVVTLHDFFCTVLMEDFMIIRTIKFARKILWGYLAYFVIVMHGGIYKKYGDA